ncbi:MAG: manganese efflux pump [Oscillospiraceae bacterium]|nr:manganese efflux pump [Oscillospiraceae bacterium]
MDAFSVSLANGLNEPCMKLPKLLGIAGVFAAFQALMPMIGWVCVHTMVEKFTVFAGWIPYIALVLLCYIGGNMIYEGLRGDCDECLKVGLLALLGQGIATSIDALSVGFTISEYGVLDAVLASLIIAAVTFVVCTAGGFIGKSAGTKLAGKANILGGVILVAIGIKIFLDGVL